MKIMIEKIPVDAFIKAYGDMGGEVARAIDREFGPESQSRNPNKLTHILYVPGVARDGFRDRLYKWLGYHDTFFVGDRGEHVRGVKAYRFFPDYEGNNQRHVKGWEFGALREEDSISPGVYSTAHNEPSPFWTIVLPWNLPKHLKKGMGNYASGTHDFEEEWQYFDDKIDELRTRARNICSER